MLRLKQIESRRWRFTLIILTIAIVALALSRHFVVSGHIIPVSVDGDSMYPTLLGEHLQVRCADCGFVSRMSLQFNHQPYCLHCRSEEVSHPTYVAADRVLIQKWKLWRRDVPRGSLVAFTEPNHEGRIAVKRVVGLPGEHVAILDGRVFCDGEAISLGPNLLVNDDRYRRQNLSHWRNVEDGQWRQQKHGFHLKPSMAEHRKDWLTYEPLEVQTGNQPNLVTDDIPFNRTVQRRLYEVHDLSVEGWVAVSGNGTLTLKYQVEPNVAWRAEYDVGAQYISFSDGEHAGRRDFSSDRFRIGMQRREQEMHFFLGEDEGWKAALPARTGSGRFLIGAANVEVTLHGLVVRKAGRVSLDAPEIVKKSSWTLGPDEFFVLGDNSPVSRDSRHFSAIRRADLLGIVVRY